MEFKELYKFTIDQEKEVVKEHTRKNKKTGEETTVKKTVKEKVPVEVRLKRPSRRELEDAELEYSVEMSRCVKRGILTKAMLYKKYSDTGGVFSEQDAKDYGKLYTEVLNLQNEYVRLDSADIKAQNRLLLWYTLMLTHVQGEDDEQPVPYFKGEDFDQRVEDYYKKEDESDEFYLEVVKKVTTILAFWFFNQASTPDEFNALIEQMEKGEL
jgi:hypothetical protein